MRLRRITAAKIRRRIVGQCLRQGDDNSVDGGMREKGCDAALEDRAATHLNQLLRFAGAEPLAATAGGNEGCDVHG